MSGFLKRAAREARGKWPWVEDDSLDPSLDVDLGADLCGIVEAPERTKPDKDSGESACPIVDMDLGPDLEPTREFASRQWQVEANLPDVPDPSFEPDLGEDLGTWTVADRGPSVAPGEDRFFPVPASYEPSAYKSKSKPWNEDPRVMTAQLKLTGPAMSRQEAVDAAKALNGLLREVLES